MSKTWSNGLAVLVVGLLCVQMGCSTEMTPKQSPTTMNTVQTPQQKPAQTPPQAAATMPSQAPAQTLDLKEPMDRVSYSLGAQMARSLKAQGVELNVTAATMGMMDAMAGNRQLMSDDEMRLAVGTLQNDMKAKMVRARVATAQENRKEGEQFLAANKMKEGVVTLPSGLQYKILKAGKGLKPRDNDVVTCYYKGSLISGIVFDSSDHVNNEGEPAHIKIAEVIPGWREALKLMPVGSKWQIFIPSDLAYAALGSGRDIGPDVTLIFEVELVDILN